MGLTQIVPKPYITPIPLLFNSLRETGIMTLFHLAFFLFFLIGPVVLAWFKGDQLIAHFSRRQRQRKMHKRQKATRALPVREDVMSSLLHAENRRNQIDDHIGEALNLFHQTTEHGRTLIAHHKAVSELDAIEQLVLLRESRFSDFLEIAQLQSETIETLTQEVDLLRSATPITTEQTTEPHTQASAQLLANLNRAVQKRQQIDQKLTKIGPQKPRPNPTSHIDITIE